jgi:hypothetical protein
MSSPTNNKEFAAISINDSSVSYPPNSKLFCNLCNCSLTLLDSQTEEWFCTRCNVSYYPNRGEKVKRANKFETPGPLTDVHGNITGEKTPIVSIIDDTPNLRPNKPTFPRSLERLKRTGVNITDFNSTVDGEGI